MIGNDNKFDLGHLFNTYNCTKQFDKTTNVFSGNTNLVVKSTITSNQQGPSASQRTKLFVKRTKISLNFIRTCVFQAVNHQYSCRNHIDVSYFTKLSAVSSRNNCSNYNYVNNMK